MRRYLPALADAGAGGSVTAPIVFNYLTNVLIPRTGTALTARNDAELRVLAAAADALLVGDVVKALDLILQQFRAVELAQSSGSWLGARHLIPVPTSEVTTLSVTDTERLYKQEQRDAKALKAIQELAHRDRAPRGTSRGSGASSG